MRPLLVLGALALLSCRGTTGVGSPPRSTSSAPSTEGPPAAESVATTRVGECPRLDAVDQSGFVDMASGRGSIGTFSVLQFPDVVETLWSGCPSPLGARKFVSDVCVEYTSDVRISVCGEGQPLAGSRLPVLQITVISDVPGQAIDSRLLDSVAMAGALAVTDSTARAQRLFGWQDWGEGTCGAWVSGIQAQAGTAEFAAGFLFRSCGLG